MGHSQLIIIIIIIIIVILYVSRRPLLTEGVVKSQRTVSGLCLHSKVHIIKDHVSWWRDVLDLSWWPHVKGGVAETKEPDESKLYHRGKREKTQDDIKLFKVSQLFLIRLNCSVKGAVSIFWRKIVCCWWWCYCSGRDTNPRVRETYTRTTRLKPLSRSICR